MSQGADGVGAQSSTKATSQPATGLARWSGGEEIPPSSLPSGMPCSPGMVNYCHTNPPRRGRRPQGPAAAKFHTTPPVAPLPQEKRIGGGGIRGGGTNSSRVGFYTQVQWYILYMHIPFLAVEERIGIGIEMSPCLLSVSRYARVRLPPSNQKGRLLSTLAIIL